MKNRMYIMFLLESVYFLPPPPPINFHVCASDNITFSLRLKPIDVKFMKMLHEKVNIVPVIGKADSLTKNEIAKLKKRVCLFITPITFKYFIVHCIFICFGGNVRF